MTRISLLQAHNNPSTIEELSIELGIAAPYMEEEVNILYDATLLEKVGNKYLTKFYIAYKECQMTIYQTQRQNAKERSEIIDRIIVDSYDEIMSLNIIRNNMSCTDIKWLFIILAADYIPQQVDGYNIKCPVKRSDNGNWGFVGYENNDITEPIVMGDNWCGNSSVAMFEAFKINNYNLWHRIGEMSYHQVLL